MSIQRAFEWTAPNGETLRLLLYPAPRLQVEQDPDDWADTVPAKWPCVLFAKLAEMVGALAEGGDIPGDCFEVSDVEVGDMDTGEDDDEDDWDGDDDWDDEEDTDDEEDDK